MNTYKGDELDSKIADFLDKKTARFPELHYIQKKEKKYVFAGDFKNFMHDYSTILKRFTHA